MCTCTSAYYNNFVQVSELQKQVPSQHKPVPSSPSASSRCSSSFNTIRQKANVHVQKVESENKKKMQV